MQRGPGFGALSRRGGRSGMTLSTAQNDTADVIFHLLEILSFLLESEKVTQMNE